MTMWKPAQIQKRRACVGLIIWTILLAVIPKGMAQTTTATISGVVTDETGAVVPRAQAVVMNTDTGVQRSTTTDDKGSFLVAELPPGPYQVTVSQTGFETLVRKGITLVVGQQANLSLAMKVGAVTEQVTVTGEAPVVNTSNSSVSGVVEQTRIEELPLNGRDFSQLPLVQPGVSAIRNGDVTVSKGYGTRIAMGGSRPDQTAWLLDGTNINSISNFGTPGSAAGLMLGVDAVREFQVLTSDYSADLGGTSGGVVNMVTKSGTNTLHGSLFEFLRNSDLDARNFFDVQKPPFKRNQFGGSLGGAIKKDKTFFFGSFEGLRERQATTTVATVPDANVHQGLIPVGGGLQQVTVAPEISPYLNLWPLPNGPSNGGSGTLIQASSNPITENYFVIRVDHHINDKQSLFARFTYDQGSATTPDPVPITSTVSAPHTRYATVQDDWIVSPQFLMTTRVAYNRTLLLGNDNPDISYPSSLNIFFPGYLPQLSYSGINILGPNGQNFVHRAQNLYQFQENIQYIHGSHSLRFGGEYIHIGTNKQGEIAGINGTLAWNTLSDFLADNRLLSFAAVAQGSDSARTLKQSVYGIYFQDDWKMLPNFTWNFGARWEPYGLPTDKYGRISTLVNWVTGTQFQTGIGLWNNPSKKDFSPRVGFAWDPKGDGKTAVRAGFGIFFVDILGPYYLLPSQKNPPFFAATASVLGNLATAVSDVARISLALLSSTVNPNDLCECIQYNLNPSYEMKFNFAVERQLPGNLSVSAGYLGGRGVHLWRTADGNDAAPILVDGRPFIPAGALRPNQQMGVLSVRYSDAQSFYNALQIEVKKRFSHGFQFQSSYTWSKNIDDSTTGVAGSDFTPGSGGNGSTSDSYYPKGDRGLSSLDQPQTFVINGIYDIPSPAAKGFTGGLWRGWQIASIFTADTGAPFSVYVSGRNAPDLSRFTGIQFPDRVASRSSSSIVTGNPNRYFDPTAFFLPPAGFYGDGGRNTLLGPGLVDFDFSLHKNTPVPIKEGARLDFSADFFNLLNRANLANPQAPQNQVLNPTSRSYIPTAGQIIKTVTSSRQLQFGLKLVF